ncbi:MAG: UDPGP type 1 family protein [Planctomycetes bacterium]|nr:UDPGP type 1 family protein [Planctomycetota bacterium]
MTETEIIKLRQDFEAAGQGQVFKYFDELAQEEQQKLLTDCAAVDLEWISARRQEIKEMGAVPPAPPRLEPAPIITLPESEVEKQQAALAREVGEQALRDGRLAAFVVAGGQGTRLGFDGPKGNFPIGPVTDRTLFQIHAEQIRARSRRYGVIIPWYVMTSPATDGATKEVFQQNNYYGFAKEDVFFLVQEMVPALDFDGKLILASKSGLATNPNGHGGCFRALNKSGASADMKRRGIDTISYFQIDNALVTICDPVFVGYHLLAGAEMSSKVLNKNAPDEKVGTICLRGGKTSVIEYSDLDDENMHACDADGRLKYWAGSIAIHMLSVDFIKRVGTGMLPWHIAIKEIPCLGPGGQLIDPPEPNAIKFETFIFDALPLTRTSVTMEVVREDEFAPLKNSKGIDSIDSARKLLSDYAGRMLAEAGVEIPRDDTGGSRSTIEISPLYALDAPELRGKVNPMMKVAEKIVLE